MECKYPEFNKISNFCQKVGHKSKGIVFFDWMKIFVSKRYSIGQILLVMKC